MMPAVVLGGGLTALSVTRALGRAGVAVTVLDDDLSNCPARHSRYCARFVPFRGAGTEVLSRWLEWLLACEEAAVLLPGCDDAVELIGRHRQALLGAGHLPAEGDDDVLLAMLDKEEAYRRARLLGVRAPSTEALRTGEDLEAAAGRFPYPCGFKPVQPHHFLRRLAELPAGTPAKGGIVASAAELRERAGPVLAAGVGVLLTEVVPGRDDALCSYYSYLDENGQPLFHFTKRKLRQHPNHFGSGCYQVTQWQADVAQLGVRLFQGLGLRGMANVEFKRDSRDGTLNFIECNPRFTAGNELLRRAGVDLAVLAYVRATGRTMAPPAVSHRRRFLWSPLEDWHAYRQYQESGELSTPAWLSSLLHVQHFAVADPHDPGPTAAQVAARLRSRFRPMSKAPEGAVQPGATGERRSAPRSLRRSPPVSPVTASVSR